MSCVACVLLLLVIRLRAQLTASFQSHSRLEYNDSKHQDKRGYAEAKDKETFNQ
jgi:hypothetical protein